MSSEKTKNLGLHTWVPDDYVQMTEFNENFKKIDEKTGELVNTSQETNVKFVEITEQLAEIEQKVDNAEKVTNITDNYSVTLSQRIQAGHFIISAFSELPPGKTSITAGDGNIGYYEMVDVSDMGELSVEGRLLEFNGENLLKAIGLYGVGNGEVLFNDVPWMKYAWKGKTLYIPMRSIAYKYRWDEIYNAGAIYGDDTIGFLPPSGMVGRKDVYLRVDATTGQFIGKGFTYEFPDEHLSQVIFPGDTIVVQGFTNTNNNGEFTVTAVTDTAITVAEKDRLVTEVGNKYTRLHAKRFERIQDARVTLDGKKYRVRLIKAANDLVTEYGEYDDFVGENNEYTNLVLASHEKSHSGNWDIPEYVGAIQTFWLNLTSRDLNTSENPNHNTHPWGEGAHIWAQEVYNGSDNAPNKRIARGGANNDGSMMHSHWVGADSVNMGYKPVLELIEESGN